MAKFCGKIGYVKPVEVEPGLWEAQVTERLYYGDITRASIQQQPSGGVNDNINISNSMSIIADPYANENSQYLSYVEIKGTKWKITSFEIQYPRLLLTIGGVYNGK